MNQRDVVFEYISEIRYAPVASLLDIRGRIADAVAAQTDFKHWNIGANRVDFSNSDTDPTEKAFVGFRNLGYVVRNPATENYFADRAARFLRELTRARVFKLPTVERFGVRARALLPFAGTFQELLDSTTETCGIDVRRMTMVADGDLDDIGPVLIVRRNDNWNSKVRVQFGPMLREQSAQAFPANTALPEVGLYVDVDQHAVDLGLIPDGTVTSLLRDFSRQCLDVVAGYERLVLLPVGR